MLTCALQVALVGLGKTTDHVALGTPFTDPAWRAMLGHYSEMFAAMGFDSVPDSQWQFHPLDGYYESVAKSLPEVDLTNLYMISGSNEPLHQDPEALAVSRNVNSKLHFAEHAPQAGLPVPVAMRGRYIGPCWPGYELCGGCGEQVVAGIIRHQCG